tara:strand:- start:402 stop:1148 length:747 start_codon:yes stop_codon:yes gene_type:complete
MNVMLSCDDNPYYSDFWPFVRDLWQKRIGIEPKLIFVNEAKETETFEDGILYIKKLDDYPVYLQAQLARIYFTQMFEDEICLLSDIDMFPVSTVFFDKAKIEAACDENTFFHLNPERREFGQLPICYYCGYGSLYKKLFDNTTWQGFLDKIINLDFDTDKFNFRLPQHLQGNNLWFSDEVFLFSQIGKHKINIKPNNEFISNRRLDREGILRADWLALMNNGFVDIHLPRPYKDYSEMIDKIYDTLMM